MENYQIKRKYAYDYAYDHNGDKSMVDAYVSGFKECEQIFFTQTPSNIIQLMINGSKKRMEEISRYSPSKFAISQEFERMIDESNKITDILIEAKKKLDDCGSNLSFLEVPYNER